MVEFILVKKCMNCGELTVKGNVCSGCRHLLDVELV